MKLAISLVALALATSTASAGPCAMPQVIAHAMTIDGAQIDQHGGIVVALSAALHGPAIGQPGEIVTAIDKLAWTINGKATKPTVLAPGLALLRSTDAKLLVADSKKQKQVSATTISVPDDDMKVNEAPKPKELEYRRFVGPRSSTQTTTLTLSAAPPAGTVAVLVYTPAAHKAGQPASSWAPVPGASQDAKVIPLFQTGRCIVNTSGAGPFAGDKVVLVWLDRTGHRSLPSSEITVK